jgi:hypothetical protein
MQRLFLTVMGNFFCFVYIAYMAPIWHFLRLQD